MLRTKSRVINSTGRRKTVVFLDTYYISTRLLSLRKLGISLHGETFGQN
nr:MAG TPA: hypothetical protein [Caudoviricetes sp.]